MLSSADTARNRYVQRVIARRHAALRIDLRYPQTDAARCAGVCIFEIDQDFCMAVLTLCLERTAAAACRAAEAAAKQRLEEVAEVTCVTTRKLTARELEAGIPIRWRAEILTCLPIGAELIVCGAFFRIAEDFVCLTHFLEARLGVLFLADVGMVFARELAIRAFDVVLGRIARDTHDLIV